MAVQVIAVRVVVAGAAHDRLGPILLKNSVSRLKGPNWQNFFPRRHPIANYVCRTAICENKVPDFQSKFRVAEFFNTIGRKPPQLVNRSTTGLSALLSFEDPRC